MLTGISLPKRKRLPNRRFRDDAPSAGRGDCSGLCCDTAKRTHTRIQSQAAPQVQRCLTGTRWTRARDFLTNLITRARGERARKRERKCFM